MEKWLKVAKTDEEIEDEIEQEVAKRAEERLEPFDPQAELVDINGEFYLSGQVQDIREEVEAEFEEKYPGYLS